MQGFANLLRCYVGINFFQGYRGLNFPWFFKFLVPRRRMISKAGSTEHLSEVAITPDTLQEKGDKSTGVSIAIQNTPDSKDSNSKHVVVPEGGPSCIEVHVQPPLLEPGAESNSSDDSPYESIAFDEFFHVSIGNSSFRGSCPTLAAHCGWLWNMLDSPYTIPFWLLLMSAPLSAAVIGALHMHSCPGAAHLAIMLFSMGITYSAALALKISFILLRVLGEEENWKHLLKSCFGVTAILTIGLCVTESAYFWQMEASQEPDSSKYCDPFLITYAFWWNCFMWFGLLTLFFCQG